jgi:hypothetical protein
MDSGGCGNQDSLDCAIAKVLASVNCCCTVNDRDDGEDFRYCIVKLIDHSFGRLSWKSRRNDRPSRAMA